MSKAVGSFSLLVTVALLSFVVIGSLPSRAAADRMTPLLLAVHDGPVPFVGSDGLVHLVYELWMANSSSATVAVEKVTVTGDGAVLQTLDSTTIARRLQPLGQRDSAGELAKSSSALLFLNVALPPGSPIPHQL